MQKTKSARSGSRRQSGKTSSRPSNSGRKSTNTSSRSENSNRTQSQGRTSATNGRTSNSKTNRSGNSRGYNKPGSELEDMESRSTGRSKEGRSAAGRSQSSNRGGSSAGRGNTSNPGGTKSSMNRSKSENNKTGRKKAETKNYMERSQLMKLFEDELKDIYWAEKALTKAIPKMIKNATSRELKEALQNHLEETEGQVSRAEQVFELLDQSPKAKKCEAMQGLVEEAEEIMKNCEAGPMRDAGIISAAQKVEHYEIASYGTLRQFAETLGLDEAMELLQQTLDEEKEADEKLTEIAETSINMEASEKEEDEDEDEDEEEDEDENQTAAEYDEDSDEEENENDQSTGKTKGFFF